MTQEETTLPPSLQWLWGLQPQKEARTGLNVARIVRAAIDLADAEGLEAVSMSRVAKELGFTTMSLYRHVEGKDELLELMLDVASGDPPETTAPPGAWRVSLEQWTWAQLWLLRRRVWMVHAPISGIPTGPYRIAWIEAGLRALRNTDLNDFERLGVILLLAGYVRNEVVIEHELEQGRERSGQGKREMEQNWGRNLAALLDPQRFPELSRIAASGAFEPPESADDVDPDAEFTFGLARILDGVDVLLRQRAKGRANR